MSYLFLIGDKLASNIFTNFNKIRCKTVREAFDKITKDSNKIYRFKLIYAVIYIDLFKDFCELYNPDKFKDYDFLIASIIFCDNVYDYINEENINDLLYNPGGITDNYYYIKKYIESVQNSKFSNLEKGDLKDIKEEMKDIKAYGEKSYYNISNVKNNIIIPTIMPKLIELMFKSKFLDKLITNMKLYEFQRFLLYNYRDDKELFNYILPSRDKILKVPYEILGKYFLYLYTMGSDFYKELNQNLTYDKWLDTYRQYIYVLFYSLSKESLKSFKNNKEKETQELYRGNVMARDEYKHLQEKFDKKNKEEKTIFYSKNFLSFSKEEDVAEDFAKNSSENQDLIKIIYILKVEDSSDYMNNIDVGNNSQFEDKEAEVLFFPFSCFMVEKIEDLNKKYNLTVFHLKYLSGANDIIKNEVKNKPIEKIKKKLEEVFLNGYGKYICKLFKGINEIYDSYIEEKTGIKIKSKIPEDKVYEDEKDAVTESFKIENQLKFHFLIERSKNIENILDEVIYDVDDNDFDESGYIRIIGENEKGNDFLKMNKEKAYLIINGKKEKLCYKYKLNKGQNTIKFVFEEEPTNLSFLFCDCTSLVNISTLAKWKVGKVTDFSFLFCGCIKLSNISPLRNWDVGNGINFSNMFHQCTSIKSLSGLKNWDVGNGNHFSYFFYNCSNLNDITGLKKWDVSKGQFFTCIFSGCTSLSDISPLKEWNVGNGQYFDYLFAGCTSLEDIEGLENWDVSKGNYFDYLFCNCTNLKGISALKNWQVNNGINFSYMFYNCFSLSDITALEDWNVDNGENFFYMFKKCHILENTKPSWFYKTI